MKAFIIIVAAIIFGGSYLWNNYNSDTVLNWAQAHQTSSASPKAEYYIVWYNYQTSHYEKAIEAARQLMKNHDASPYKPDAYFLMAMSYRQLNNREMAMQTLSQFVKMYPNHPNAKLAQTNIDLLK